MADTSRDFLQDALEAVHEAGTCDQHECPECVAEAEHDEGGSAYQLKVSPPARFQESISPEVPKTPERLIPLTRLTPSGALSRASLTRPHEGASTAEESPAERAPEAEVGVKGVKGVKVSADQGPTEADWARGTRIAPKPEKETT